MDERVETGVDGEGDESRLEAGGPGEGRPEEGARRPPRSRWAWTLVFAVLVPAGAFLMVATGGPYGDQVLRIIGGALLAAAVVIALWLLAGGEGEEDGEEVNR